MHWIARHILKELAFADEKRYVELKPDGVESNLFQYHARLLEQKGLIERRESGYRLSKAGRAYVADLSLSKHMKVRKQPQPMVAVVCRRGDEWLLFRWKRHPYRGRVTLPMGRQLFGMSVLEAAADQLHWKAGLHGEAQYLGQIEIIKPGVYHSLLNVVWVDIVDTEIDADGLTGESFWAMPENVGGDDFIEGWPQIIAWCNDKRRSPLLTLEIQAKPTQA